MLIFDAHDVTNNIMHVYTMSQIIFDACLHDVTNNI